jgi:hypothetical protein
MRIPGGYAVISEPGRADVELDSITCFHCNRVVFVKAGQDPSALGGFCRVCMRHLCGPCADLGTCTPYEREMEKAEARDRFLRSAGISGA